MVSIQTHQVKNVLTNTTFPDKFVDLKKDDLQLAVYQFVYRFCEKLLVFYTEFKDQNLSQKKYLEGFIVQLFEIIGGQSIEIIKMMHDLLSRFVDYLKESSNVENAKNYEIQMKNYCYKTITEGTNFFSIVSLYISTFSTMEPDISVMSPISGCVIGLIEELCKYFTEIKAKEETISKLL